jgi:hypothetical protein
VLGPASLKVADTALALAAVLPGAAVAERRELLLAVRDLYAAALPADHHERLAVEAELAGLSEM